jgi:hypothetical protein
MKFAFGLLALAFHANMVLAAAATLVHVSLVEEFVPIRICLPSNFGPSLHLYAQ